MLIASLSLLLPMSASKGDNNDDSARTDRSRQGFSASAAIGTGVVSFHQVHYLICGKTWKSPTHTKLALHTKGKIGYAPTDYFVSYLVTESYWFPLRFAAIESQEIARSGLFGIGMTFYSSSAAPSAYLFFEIGRSFFGAPFERKIGTQLGTGSSAGLGYQFSRRYSIEVSASRVTATSPGLVTNVWSYSISLNLN